MTSRRASASSQRAKSAKVVGDTLRLTMVDGTRYDVPLGWFPSIHKAPEKAKRKVRMDGRVGLVWPDLGWELGVGGLVRRCRRTRECNIVPVARPTRRPGR